MLAFIDACVLTILVITVLANAADGRGGEALFLISLVVGACYLVVRAVAG